MRGFIRSDGGWGGSAQLPGGRFKQAAAQNTAADAESLHEPAPGESASFRFGFAVLRRTRRFQTHRRELYAPETPCPAGKKTQWRAGRAS